MSYLDGPRITFAGRFFSDVPTRNNDPNAYRPDPPALINAAIWNMSGGGTFDLLGCHVDGGEIALGTPLAADDPMIGAAVVGASDRVSAKLVDLDTEWQFSSQLWGLTIRLLSDDGVELLVGSFRTAAFRDLWSRPGVGSAASFTSVLENVVFSAASRTHPVLDALREASPTSELSVVLNTFGFASTGNSRPMTGSVTGCIGPRHEGEPFSFVAGRRFEFGQARGATGQVVPIGRAVAAVSGNPPHLVLDLGNAYPFAGPDGAPDAAVSALEVAVLPTETLQVDDTFPDSAEQLVIGEIRLMAAFPQAAIVTLPLTAEAAAAAVHLPLALLQKRAGQRHVVARETAEGLYVRADDFIHRIEAQAPATTTFHARRHGAPATDQKIHLVPTGPLRDTPAQIQTGRHGTATLSLTTVDPGGPRPPIDGAIAQVKYSPRRASGGALDLENSGLDPRLDRIVAHVYDVYPEPANLEAAVQQILAPYGSIYPVMSHLVDLSQLKDVARWRAAMLLSLTRDITDPNHMPVTRDLSAAKRAAIVRWLEQLPPEPRGMARVAVPPHTGVGREPDPEVRVQPDQDEKGSAAREVVERAMANLDAARSRTDRPQE